MTKATSISVKEMRRFWENKFIIDNDNSTMSSKSDIFPAISCSVKTITVEGHELHLIHQIEMECNCCKSCFIVRATHTCEGDVDSGNSGLEWIKSDINEEVNLAF
jgi:hypothetical protein